MITSRSARLVATARAVELAKPTAALRAYLRRQLIHGARAALPYIAERDTRLGRWAKALLERTHHNVAVVAFANKLAGIALAILPRRERSSPQKRLVAA